jgi:superfamily I DNA/RNA helicase
MVKRMTQPIGPLILKNYAFLKKLAKTKSNKKRKSLLDSANRDQLLALVEISSNLLSSFKLGKKQRNRLLPFAPTIRKLSRVRSERSARKLIQQTGTGVPLFAALLAPVIAEAASHLISKVIKRG